MTSVYSQFKDTTQKTRIALLIDPDECSKENLKGRLAIANETNVNFVFLGGSLVTQSHLDDCIAWIKSETDIPLVLFPGNDSHISPNADAVLLLSLISGRNADLLIGKHVQSAPIIRQFAMAALDVGAFKLIVKRGMYYKDKVDKEG